MALSLPARACELAPPTPSALAWEVTRSAGDYAARSANWPGLEIPVTPEAPVIPRVLDWVVLPRYARSVALLQYMAGSAGTRRDTPFVYNVVVDLARGNVLGTAPFEIACDQATWTWYDDRVRVDDGEVWTYRFNR